MAARRSRTPRPSKAYRDFLAEAEEILREIKAQYRPESDVSEKKQQLQKAIAVVTRQQGIVSQKAEQMSEMKAHLEERLRTFARWMGELESQESKAPVA